LNENNVNATLQSLRHEILVLLCVFVAAVALGFGLNVLRERPLPILYRDKETRLKDSVQRIQPRSKDSNSKPITEQFSLGQFAAYVAESKGVIIDARPEIFHRMGHVPGALSLPRDDFEKGYSVLRGRLESDWTQPIVVYCADASCTDASLVKKALNSLGYNNVAVFAGGWHEWTQVGKETEGGQ
jgi:3-mercaptopyruvate sulfurtransferase SseA